MLHEISPVEDLNVAVTVQTILAATGLREELHGQESTTDDETAPGSGDHLYKQHHHQTCFTNLTIPVNWYKNHWRNQPATLIAPCPWTCRLHHLFQSMLIFTHSFSLFLKCYYFTNIKHLYFACIRFSRFD